MSKRKLLSLMNREQPPPIQEDSQYTQDPAKIKPIDLRYAPQSVGDGLPYLNSYSKANRKYVYTPIDASGKDNEELKSMVINDLDYITQDKAVPFYASIDGGQAPLNLPEQFRKGYIDPNIKDDLIPSNKNALIPIKSEDQPEQPINNNITDSQIYIILGVAVIISIAILR